jgi:hypothetical protein
MGASQLFWWEIRSGSISEKKKAKAKDGISDACPPRQWCRSE